MKTVVTKRGQTVIPAVFRKKYRIKKGTVLLWIDTGESIKVVPLPEDPLKALKGIAKGESLTEKLLQGRKKDAGRE
ncbi:MAG: AbrB/MazE/SpoVT family DNA-binding domain-containing protein [Candidatus Desulfofervidaceae bacterium]|nr:AbrB/MazE/SpoVT family DNA-binding domain-containing protein [Candidatus Desulfofervidaceae bacterium]